MKSALRLPMPFDQHSQQTVVFKNNTVILAWFFMVAWIGLLVCFTTAAASSGVPVSIVVVLVVFWALGLGFAALLLRAPCVSVEVSPDGVLIRERALLWKRARTFAAADVKISDIIEHQDSDGVHYTCSLVLPDNKAVAIGQGTSRSKVEQVRVQAISALMNAKRRTR